MPAGVSLAALPTPAGLQVKRGDKWGTVCAEGFTVENARVVCRQLGKYNGTDPLFAASNYTNGPKPARNTWAGLKCSGSESR